MRSCQRCGGLACNPANLHELVVSRPCMVSLLNQWLQMFLLGTYQHRSAIIDSTGRMLTTNASALRLPALRPEDVLIQHDAHGQKVLLGEGFDGVVRRPCLDVRHAAFCSLGDTQPLVSCILHKARQCRSLSQLTLRAPALLDSCLMLHWAGPGNVVVVTTVLSTQKRRPQPDISSTPRFTMQPERTHSAGICRSLPAYVAQGPSSKHK